MHLFLFWTPVYLMSMVLATLSTGNIEAFHSWPVPPPFLAFGTRRLQAVSNLVDKVQTCVMYVLA